MDDPAVLEKFNIWEDATNLIVLIAFLTLGFNWFADLGWLAPHDGQTFGAVFMGSMFWIHYVVDRVALMKIGEKPSAWKYAMAGIGSAAVFYVGTVVVSPAIMAQ